MHNVSHRFNRKISRFPAVFLLPLMLAALSSGCTNNTDELLASSTVTPVTTAATLQLSASEIAVPSDNSSTTTITVTALNETNAALKGIEVTLSADTGIVSSPTVTTGEDGSATFTFRSGTASLANRTATITASAGATALIPIQIQGSTLSLHTISGTSVPDNGTAAVLATFVAKNAQGSPLSGTPYTVSWATGTGGQVTLNPTSGVTDSNGMFTISVAGVTGALGTATITASAAGSTASATVTVALSASTFAISETLNNATGVITPNPSTVAMFTSDTLTVTVAAPDPISEVTFITSSGDWNGGGQKSLVVPVSGAAATATLGSPPAGTTTVQVLSDNGDTDSLSVSVTAKVPHAITLQASPSYVTKSAGTTTGVASLIATVVDATGAPVGDAPVVFSLSNTTGGGEAVSPVLAYTTSIAGTGLALGQASTTFTSGSAPSTADGVQIRATVLGTNVATEANLPKPPLDTNPSGNDAAVVIGGTAGSMAFGLSTEISENDSKTAYGLAMSVLVSDVNGNPAANTVVTLSAWPIAWSTGTQVPCAPDPDNAGSGIGTFYNEDVNENLVQDALEDGTRKYFANNTTVAGGTVDNALTPANSAAGTLPASVLTDEDGVANFHLTYLKSSAIWTMVRIRATAVVQGSEAVSQTVFRLKAAEGDVDPVCRLSSPYSF